MSTHSEIDPAVAYLHSHGIRVTPGHLDEMVREAVDRMPQTLYRSDPRQDLTRAEAEALERGGFDLDPTDLGAEDPLVQTAAELSALLKQSLPTAVAAERLGVDPSRIRQRLTSDPPSLYGVRLGPGWVVPEFQFEGDALIPGVGEVVTQLDRDLHPVAVFRWFTLPNVDLLLGDAGEEPRRLSPREWLRLGLPIQPVVDLASAL